MALFDFFKGFFPKPTPQPLIPSEPEKPNAVMVFEDGKLQVKSYNKAFVDDLKVKLGDLTLEKTDDEIVALFLDREQIQLEEPKLEVIHSGITEDGRIQMKLDWNQAFIRHLRDHGITAETDEEAVETYLMLIGKEAAGQDDLKQVLDPTEAFREMDEMLAAELDEAAKAVADSQRKTRQTRRKLKKPENGQKT